MLSTPRLRLRRVLTAALTAAALVGGSVLAALPAQSVSSGLVVSRVYGAGGNTGATLNADYIELFNRGSAPASLDGLSLQYASATGTGAFGSATNTKTELPNVTVPAGGYYLVQEASGANGAALPTPDLIDPTPISLAAAAGKVALVTGADTLGCNGGSIRCDAGATARIIDLVGFGTTNYFEGSGPAPAPSTTTDDARKVAGCTDTDDNAADFTAVAPAPRNSSTPVSPCGGPPPGDAAPTVTSTTPANGATDVPVSSNVSVIFSEPVNVTASTFDLSCASSGSHAVSVGGGTTTYSLDPTTDFGVNELCTLKVIAANMDDVDSNDPPTGMAADYSTSFRTAPPAASCTDTQLLISQVQGSGLKSPQENNVVTVEAVVTAIKPGLSGFYIQEEVADQDTSPLTSEGIFVRTGSSTPPAGIEVGDVVQVKGGVVEFAGSGAGRTSSLTQISVGVTFLDCGTAPVPPAAVLQLPVTDFNDFEHFEGMQVTMPQALVISEYFNYGQFNEIVAGIPPNGRDRFDSPTAVQEPNTAATAALLDTYARSRITVDDGRSASNPTPPYFPGTVNTPFTLTNTFRGGDTLTGVTGVVEHTFGLYRVHPTTDATYTSVNARPTVAPDVGGDTKIASFNVLNYFLTLTAGINKCGPDARPGLPWGQHRGGAPAAACQDHRGHGQGRRRRLWPDGDGEHHGCRARSRPRRRTERRDGAGNLQLHRHRGHRHRRHPGRPALQDGQDDARRSVQGAQLDRRPALHRHPQPTDTRADLPTVRFRGEDHRRGEPPQVEGFGLRRRPRHRRRGRQLRRHPDQRGQGAPATGWQPTRPTVATPTG